MTPVAVAGMCDPADLVCGRFSAPGSAPPQATATTLKPGYRHIDTATGYDNEAGIDELTAATGVIPAVNQIRRSPGSYAATVAIGLAERGVVLEGYSPSRPAWTTRIWSPSTVSAAEDGHIPIVLRIVSQSRPT